jgi:neutral ceramidase
MKNIAPRSAPFVNDKPAADNTPMRFISFLIVCTFAASSPAAELRVGSAAVVITPQLGTPLAGYYNTRISDGVHDDLYAKALVLECGDTRAAMVCCDLITMPPNVAAEARRLIEKETGLKADQVMISATHTHTGPILPGRTARETADGPGGELAAEYVQQLPARIAASVKQAVEKLAPATASAAIGREQNLSFNRRFFMKDGTVGWNPGKLNPKIERPAGPIDPAVSVVYFESTDGVPLLSYVNFSMHPDTVGGLQVSADYAATLCNTLSRIKGDSMITLFTNGTCGDINHVDVSSKDPQKGFDEARRIGTILAGEVIKTYARLKRFDADAIRFKREVVKLDLPKSTPEELQKARQTAVKFGKEAPNFLERVNAFKIIDVAAREGKPWEVEVQVIALGDDVAWVALPGEIFVELGLAIKQASPFKTTIIAELANGAIGYIPTQKAFEQGNYEPLSARCAPGSGELLAETAIKLLNEIKEKR